MDGPLPCEYELSRNDVTYRDHVQYFLFKYSCVLDPNRLRASLEHLIKKGHWQKIGGYLKINTSGRLAICIPSDAKGLCPSIDFHNEKHGTNVKENVLAASLPLITPASESRIFSSCEAFAPLARTEKTPKTLQEYISSKKPVMSVLVTSFSDATILGICWPHVLMDGISFSEFLRSWSHSIADREVEIGIAADTSIDQMWQAGDPVVNEAREEWSLQRYQLKGFDFLKFQARYLWNALAKPSPERRLLVLSKTHFDRLVFDTREELARCFTVKAHADGTFISEGDILIAWMLKAANKHKSWENSRPTSLGQALNVRPFLGTMKVRHDEDTTADRPDDIYLSNVLSAVYTFLPRGFLQREPIFRIALEQRESIKQQVTRSQIHGLLRHHRQSYERDGIYQPVFGTSDSDLYFMTNATKLDLQHALDLSPAIVRDKEETETPSPARAEITSYLTGFQSPRSLFPGIIILHGKDQFGNVWISATLHRECWAGIEDCVNGFHRR